MYSKFFASIGLKFISRKSKISKCRVFANKFVQELLDFLRDNQPTNQFTLYVRRMSNARERFDGKHGKEMNRDERDDL